MSEKKTFNNYDFFLIDDFTDFDTLLYKKEKAYGLCRMIAGYAWPWNSKKNKSKIDIVIDGIQKQWNYKTMNWIEVPNSIDQVGCIHSIQGYDLNYAFVILGNDIYYDEKKNKICINKSSYFDRNGKNTASYRELDTYIKNIYYVLMTRGIRGTFLYICDPALRNYIKNYVEVL